MATNPIGAFLVNVWGAANIAAVLATPFWVGRRNRWGSTSAELRRVLPGDELVPAPRWTSRNAISIAGSRADVWPWVAQVGQGRGGLYSFEGLENLIGCQIHNAESILPEFQSPKIGDPIRLHPKMPAFPVSDVVADRYLLLHGHTGTPGDPAYLNVVWLFFLDDAPDGSTRLMSSWRYDYAPTFSNAMAYGPYLTGAINFVMGRRMLYGIKTRVERATGRVKLAGA